MLVALDRQHDFFTGKGLLNIRSLRRLRLVPLAVVFRSGVDVVGCGVAILNVDSLPGHYAQHVRMITAALLIKAGGLFWNIEAAIAKAIFHINKDVGQVSTVDDNGFRFVSALAGRVLAHVDFGQLGSCAVELHRAIYGGYSIGINGSGCRSCFLLRGIAGFRTLFLAAGGQEQNAEQRNHTEDDYPRLLTIHDLPFLKASNLSTKPIILPRSTPCRMRRCWLRLAGCSGCGFISERWC